MLAKSDSIADSLSSLTIEGAIVTGYGVLSNDDNDSENDLGLYRLPVYGSLEMATGRTRLSVTIPFHYVGDNSGWSRNGIDDVFLRASINPVGLQWSNFLFGMRISQPFSVFMEKQEGLFTTGYAQDNLDYFLGFDGQIPVGSGQLKPGLLYIYSTRNTSDNVDSYYDYLKPGNVLALTVNHSDAISDKFSVESDIVLHHRFSTKTIEVLPDGDEIQNKLDDYNTGLNLHTSITYTKGLGIFVPSLKVLGTIPIDGSVSSLTFLFSVRIIGL